MKRKIRYKKLKFKPGDTIIITKAPDDIWMQFEKGEDVKVMYYWIEYGAFLCKNKAGRTCRVYPNDAELITKTKIT